MRAKSIAKVMKSEDVRSSGRMKFWASAIIDNITIETEMVIPTGTEYWRMFWTNLFLIREVLCSRARTRPGRPMQAKFKRDISMGA